MNAVSDLLVGKRALFSKAAHGSGPRSPLGSPHAAPT